MNFGLSRLYFGGSWVSPSRQGEGVRVARGTYVDGASRGLPRAFRIPPLSADQFSSNPVLEAGLAAPSPQQHLRCPSLGPLRRNTSRTSAQAPELGLRGHTDMKTRAASAPRTCHRGLADV